MAESGAYDLVVVGSGGGGLAAALTAAAAGASVVVLEKTDLIGGSTAMSGGVLWIPNSQPAERAGAQDSFDDGMRYFESVVGDAGVASNTARRTAFLRQGRELLDFLAGEGLTFEFCNGYSDYYDDRPGGKARGRVLKAPMLPSGELGTWYPKLRQFGGWALPVNTDEFHALTLAKRTWEGRFTALRLGTRVLRERLTRQRLLCRGAAVQGRMLLAALRRKVPIWTDSPVESFVLEGGRVRGVVIRRANGEQTEVRAKSGVVVDPGGFARNAEMRKRFHPQPSLPAWTAVNPGDTGEILERAMALGAATDMLDEAIWIPISVTPDGQIGGFHNPHDMAKPFCIMVDSTGQRFVNEAASYMEVGQAMYRRGAVPAWAIIESRHRRYYPWGAALAGRTPPEWQQSGYMRSAQTIPELARACGIDADGLAGTISRFNTYARQGRDEQFARGARAYDRYYGDSSHGPNPGLGAIEKPPFYAVQIYPGDVGTFGGLMTDEHGCVLRGDGSRIEGLYATGNCTASVMGRTYPGAGASIAASFIFGYSAVKNALDTSVASAKSGPTRAPVAVREAAAASR
jgi:3-oxosteroid 1-dehydrogenase